MRRCQSQATAASFFLATAGFLLLSTTPLESQTRSLSWTETTKLEVPGTLGMILRAAGAADRQPPRQGIHLQGATLIQGDDESVVVMDLERREWLWVDHQARTYMKLGFDQSMELGDEALQTVHAAARADADYDAAREELRQAMAEAQAEVEFRISSESTGRTRSFGSGISAVQHFIIGELEATAVPEGVDEPEGGSIVFLTEVWQSSDVPTADALFESWAQQLASDPAFRAMAEEMAASGEEAGVAIQNSLAMWNPEIAAALMQLSEELAAMEGTTVQTVTHVALVPHGVTLDRDELLAWEPESMGDQLRRGAASAAREAAGEAARGAIRGLTRGALGGRRGGDEAQPQEETSPVVRPLLRLTTTREDIAYEESNRDLAAALYEQLQGYREITFADLMQQSPQP